MELFLQKSVIENQKLSDEGLAVYVALRKIVNNQDNEYYISLNMLCYILTNGVKYQQRFYNSIKSGVANLIDDVKIISKVKSDNISFVNDNEFILNLKGLHFNTKKNKNNQDTNIEYFTKIRLDEVHKIMNVKNIKFQLLKYFVLLIGSIDNSSFTYINPVEEKKSFVGNLTIDNQVKYFKIPKSNIYDYNKTLEKLQLVYFYRHQDFIIDDGKTKSLHNSYGRYKDKDYIIKYGKEYANAKGSIKCNKNITKNIANKTNSLLQKYNSLYYGRGKYEPAAIKEIYDFIVDYNSKQDIQIENVLKSKNNTEMYINMQVEKFTDKKKDLSIFDKYDYLKVYIDNNSEKSKMAVDNSNIIKTVKSQIPFIIPNKENKNNSISQEDKVIEYFLNQQIAEANANYSDAREEIDISNMYDDYDYDTSYDDDDLD